VIGTLAVDGWAVIFDTARRGLGGLGPAQSLPRCTKCNSPPVISQCINFILFDVALKLPLDSKGLSIVAISKSNDSAVYVVLSCARMRHSYRQCVCPAHVGNAS